MFVQVVTFEESPDDVQAGIDHVREEVLPVLSEATGLHALWLVDRDNGRRLSIMAWDSQEQADAAFAALAAQREKLGNPPRPTPTAVDSYEVYGSVGL
jgi:quinol monooxygenase YgiN